ncbi:MULTISPECIES: hypothetical protein [Mumia]|uniref:hypothetical protein n=1 Tax=Mumia TaxID=1546255 RepID=UPI001422FCAF|nr:MULTISPECIES: hypothetical protein [unclassified Mumia]QMW65699.1 hypothetical protein H4N58_16210 [Mumia sp. ZJ1417]
MGSRDFIYYVDFPDDGWVTPPEPDETIAAWADDVVRDLRAKEGTAVALGSQLRSYGQSYRELEAETGALWIPQVDDGVLATLWADVLVAEPAAATIEAVLEAERARAAAMAVGEDQPSVEVVELPAGPAVRTRMLELGGHGLAGSASLAERVSHLIVPTPAVHDEGRPAIVRHVVGWVLLEHGDDLAELADDCATLVEIERL